MIPRQRALEKQITELALKARAGREVQSVDRVWFRRLWSSFMYWALRLFAWAFLARQILGLEHPALNAPEWQMFAGGVVLLISSGLLSGHLHTLTVSSPAAFVLANLPVPGTTILSWARRRVLIEAFRVLVTCMIVALALHGLLKTALLLWCMTVSTVIWQLEPIISNLRLEKIWIMMIALFAGLLLYLHVIERPRLDTQLSSWILQLVGSVSWLLPSTWVMPQRWHVGGYFLAIPWMAWGIWRWWSWPQAKGHLLDGPLDEIRQAGLGPEELIFRQENEPPANSRNEGVTPSCFQGLRECETASLQVFSSGWIERLAASMLTERDRQLAAILLPDTINWSDSARTGLKRFLALLVFGYVLLAVPALVKWHELIATWLWVLGSGVLLIHFAPLSNMIPNATAEFILGTSRVPAFTMLPIATRDLLRISNRLTLVRTVVFVCVATPALMCVRWVSGTTPDMPYWPCVIVPELGLLWIILRPVLIASQIHLLWCARRGRFISRIITNWTVFILLLVFVVSTLAAFGISFFIMKVEADIGSTPLLIIPFCFLLCGLSARAVFELYAWRLRTGKLDWGVAVPEEEEF